MSKSLASLCETLDDLIADVASEADAQLAGWYNEIGRDAFWPSAGNFAAYLALRRHDLRPLQRPLTALGLSSLGRLEGRVMPTLAAVRFALAAQVEARGGEKRGLVPDRSTFFDGTLRLSANAEHIFGKASGAIPIMVTCPSEAADDPVFMATLVEKRVEAVRINCAHDTPEAWARMIGHLRKAEASSPWRVRVFMDLAGPKIRTGRVDRASKHKRAHLGDLIALTAEGDLMRVRHMPDVAFAVECTLPEALTAARVGDRLFIDDGRLQATVDRIEDWGLVAEVVAVTASGLRIKSEKGLNFPDTPLGVSALTDKDRRDLVFVCAHADAVEYSFVQSAADVRLLQAALAAIRPDNWWALALVLKIETAMAVRNLPEIIVQAAGRQPAAIMIARGDLAVEIGFSRTAEIQEEILWLGEAADLPVIWATQVLDGLITTGEPSRTEMTDAAMAARAECVMLNKGRYLFEGIDALRGLLARMTDHQHKKSPEMRALHSWGGTTGSRP